MARKTKPVYSHSSVTTFNHCQKKYYFTWLARKKQGWRKSAAHPWNKVHLYNQVCHSSTWAGNLYHQIIANFFSEYIKRRSFMSEEEAKEIAHEVARRQFEYSKENRYIGAVKNHVEKYVGISIYLALFEHLYDLSDEGLIYDTQVKLDTWLTNTFSWAGWSEIQDLVKLAQNVHVEPVYTHYYVNGARILARMDLGIEIQPGQLIIYDWKCYKQSKKFEEYNRRQLNKQLRAYGFWGVYRKSDPLAIENVIGKMFNPVISDECTIKFTHEDRLDFELDVTQWVKHQADLFPDISEVVFDDLRGPFDSERTCPWCEYKAVCGQDIEWHQIT